MEYVTPPEKMDRWTIHERVEAMVPASGETMTALISVWAPGSELAAHVHPNEQIGTCIQGRAVFTIGGKECRVQKGDVYHIPPNVPHGERNDGDEDAIFFECFSPTRPDLVQKSFAATIVDREQGFKE